MDTASEAKLFSRVRSGLAAGLRRLWGNGWPVIQTAVATSVAYFLATFALGIQESFYAPIAAVVCLSLTLGEPWRRVLLVTAGVTLGLGIASLIVLVIGIGTVQMGVVVALAMGAAVLLSGRTLLVNQAAISAILVVVLQPPQQSGFSPDRFLDALVGEGLPWRLTTCSRQTPNAWCKGQRARSSPSWSARWRRSLPLLKIVTSTGQKGHSRRPEV